MRFRTKILIIFCVLFILLIFLIGQPHKVKLTFIAIGLFLDLLGVLLLSQGQPTRRHFKKEREERKKLWEDYKSGTYKDAIPLWRIDKEHEDRIVFNQYIWGIPLIILGFVFQLASIIAQIID